MKKQYPALWTEAEVARLRSLAAKVPVEQLVTEIGRSRGAITAKAFMLRLSVDHRKNVGAIAGSSPRDCHPSE
jgi:hypothetical protein